MKKHEFGAVEVLRLEEELRTLLGTVRDLDEEWEENEEDATEEDCEKYNTDVAEAITEASKAILRKIRKAS